MSVEELEKQYFAEKPEPESQEVEISYDLLFGCPYPEMELLFNMPPRNLLIPGSELADEE